MPPSKPPRAGISPASFSADTDEARKYVELKGNIAESTREQVTQTMLGSDVLA